MTERQEILLCTQCREWMKLLKRIVERNHQRNLLHIEKLSKGEIPNIVELDKVRNNLQDAALIPVVLTHLHKSWIYLRGFVLTNQTLDNLKKGGIPDVILKPLESLKNKKYPLSRFDEKIVPLLSKKLKNQFTRHKNLVLEHIEYFNLRGDDELEQRIRVFYASYEKAKIQDLRDALEHLEEYIVGDSRNPDFAKNVEQQLAIGGNIRGGGIYIGLFGNKFDLDDVIQAVFSLQEALQNYIEKLTK